MASDSVPQTPHTPLEARLPCPVCIGVQMEKVLMHGGAQSLVLDHCPRCGGVWFEKGEAQQLTRHSPADLWKHIPPLQTVPKPPCHACYAPLDRDAEKCGVCGKKNELSCPICDKVMVRRKLADLTLDVCAQCRGVWFDHAELKSLWSLTLMDLESRRPGRGAQAAAMGGDVLLESLFWAPGLVMNAGEAAVYGVGHVAGALGSISVDGAADAAMGAAEMVGGAAEGLFETIMGIISSLFD
ncbi:MAG: zf-TFIIB domain-containing protein [Gemmatimonadaceae bacterium]